MIRQSLSSLFALALLLAGWTARADGEPVSITPQQVVQAALAFSPQLKSADKEITAAQARRDQALAQSLPTLEAQAQAARFTGLQDSSFGPNFTIPAIDTRYNASLGLAQPLFTGGRLSGQRDSARFQTRAAENARAGTRADLILLALSAYWNWSKAHSALEVFQASVARMEKHAEDMRNLYDAGLATDNDTLATEALLDRMRLALAEARRHTYLARARIAFLTGQDPPENAAPEPAPEPDHRAPEPEESLIRAALTNRPECAVIRMELRTAEAQVQVRRAEYFPQLYLGAKVEEGRPNAMNIPPQDEWDYDAYVGVSARWSIFESGLTRARVVEARARADQARLRLTQTEQQVMLDVREALADLNNAVERLAVAERFEASARRNLEATTDLWQNGMARHSDVLDAYAQLAEAQQAVTSARSDVALAAANLDHARGDLSGKYSP